MFDTKEAFEKQKNKHESQLKKILEFLQHGKNLGVEIDEQMITKLNNALKDVTNEKLKVALIGGFSEGKTSIASAWLERIEANMKISLQESSDEITFYDIDDEIEIMDTPGLFGFKETNNGNKEKYKEITKKAISEAHVILYVLNPSNPIKESHKDDLKWLFEELNLLPRTIFVINKFDEIAVLEDEEDYDRNLKIKKQNIIDRISEVLGKDCSSISIVAVSARPDGEDLEYWLKDENKSRFLALSHIKDLQDETTKKIQENGGKLAIIEEAKNSISKDVLGRSLVVMKNEFESAKKEAEKIEEETRLINKHLKTLHTDIGDAKINLREFATNYFDELMLKLNNIDMETFEDFITKYIGDKGMNIDIAIRNEFARQTKLATNTIDKISIDCENIIKDNTSFFKMAGKGVNWLHKSGVINPNNIKLVRDMLNLPIKFKPWETMKIAKGANAALAGLGLIIEGVVWWQNQENQKKFQEIKTNMKDNFNKQKKELIDLVDSDDFINDFFPEYKQLQQIASELTKMLEEVQAKEIKFKDWQEEGKIIEGEILREY